MKISVITVTYNSAATVAATLRSVAAQTHAGVEHIVVDGASSDDTLAIVKKYGRPDTKVWSEADRGIYDAMNKGLRMASGDFVGFLNADDTYAGPEVLADIAQAAQSGHVDVIYGDLVYVRRNRPESVLRYWRSGAFSRSKLGFGWMPPHPTFYVRKSLVDSLGGFDPELRISADYDFMLRCLTRPGTGVAYIPKVLVRMSAGGASNRSVRALLMKSREDLRVVRANRIGGWYTVACKQARKAHQFIWLPGRARP
jgi:glycosyltransferase